jgi:hypothetical protein
MALKVANSLILRLAWKQGKQHQIPFLRSLGRVAKSLKQALFIDQFYIPWTWQRILKKPSAARSSRMRPSVTLARIEMLPCCGCDGGGKRRKF